MADAKKTVIEIKEIPSGEVVHTIDVSGKSEHVIEKTLRGVIRNLGDNFCASVAVEAQ